MNDNEEQVTWRVCVFYGFSVQTTTAPTRPVFMGGLISLYIVQASAHDLEGAAREGIRRLLAERPDALPTRVDVTLVDVRPAQPAQRGATLWDDLLPEPPAD